MNKSSGPKTKLRSFSLLPQHDKMIDEIMAKGAHMSKSEAVRQAISTYYFDLFPPYKESQRKKEAEKEKYETMSNEQYCTEVLGGRIEEAGEGAMCVIPSPENEAITARIPLKIIKGTPPGYIPGFGL